MKKLLNLILICFCLFISTDAFANDITRDNFREECHIGSIGVLDSFDMGKLNSLFGKLIEPATQTTLGRNAGLRLTTLKFANATVTVTNDKIAVVSVSTPMAIDGTALGTPRGIVVGHDLDTVLRLYGTPGRIRNYKGDIIYNYGWFEAGVNFVVDASTNKVTSIVFYIPTC